MTTPTNSDVIYALNRAKEEYPKGSDAKIVDTAWQILAWSYSQVDVKQIEKLEKELKGAKK